LPVPLTSLIPLVLWLPERRFAFLAGFLALFLAAGRRFLDFFLDEDFFLDCEYLDPPRLVYCFVNAPAISFSFGGRVFLRSFNLPFRG